MMVSRMGSHPLIQNSTSLFYLIILFIILCSTTSTTTLNLIRPAQASVCRTSCGKVPINYPFGIDDGCGSPYYRHLLVCSESGYLELRTPSGRYPVRTISYGTDPHILLTDPFMWNCQDGVNYRPTRPFSLDTSTHLSLSPQNDYLFFNCSETDVIIEPKPMFCERFPERCDSSCDSSSYLCLHLPECGSAAYGRVSDSITSCCSYYPKATESLRLMLKYCASYTSVYWRNTGATQPYDQVPEYGVRVDFEIPVTTSCLQCQDMNKGGGTCGFDIHSQDFMCLCGKENVTTYCNDHSVNQHRRVGVIAASAASVAGVFGIGAGICYLRKVRAKAPVTCGVQSSANRLF
ncbi:Wall-associated receptor kinase, galacturonan-binding domain containing protein [Parasponia andersonii]|uniref:Wall-associated receptor kinase, galacturonan-binding domain containing protein n=1 Tax=Parasponia andersonii TaxID=3476 RepID=A0A2P5BTI9_PARAD|nr:Wall-associated receptor kinase, galacturonan-binding domain containing protein [Parasponia andersonii]